MTVEMIYEMNTKCIFNYSNLFRAPNAKFFSRSGFSEGFSSPE